MINRSYFCLNIVLLFLVLAVPAHAFHADSFRNAQAQFNSTIPASLSVEVGVLNGVSRELVYEENKGQKISELQWDLDNVVIAGIKGSFDITEWLKFNGGFWTNLTQGDSGKIEDYDWDSPRDPRGWAYYSKSNVDVRHIFITDTNFEFELFELDYLTLNGLVGFKFDNYKWEDRGGSYIYSKGGWRNDRGNFPETQTGLGYEQWFYCPYLGIQTDSDFGNFNIKTYVKGTIYAWAEDEDHHYQRNLRFNDSFYNMKFLGAGISAGYSFTPNVFSNISFDYQKYYRQIGHTTTTDTTNGDTETTSNAAGADSESIHVAIELGFNF